MEVSGQHIHRTMYHKHAGPTVSLDKVHNKNKHIGNQTLIVDCGRVTTLTECNCLTIFMELNLFWEAASCSSTQGLNDISRNQKVHYRLHKSPPQVPILIQINPDHTTLSYHCKIHFNIIHPPTSSSSQWSFFHLTFPPVIVACPAHNILLDLIILIMLAQCAGYQGPHVQLSPVSCHFISLFSNALVKDPTLSGQSAHRWR
jgi:hypothetical protein